MPKRKLENLKSDLIPTKSSKKKKLGQFFTTNYQYILQNMIIPEPTPNCHTIIEPFVGNGDLINFIPEDYKYTLEMYDIDPKIKNTICQNTIETPPDFKNKFVLTNPPYLARNKSPDKTLFDKYNENDLYKCFISILIESPCEGGILIVPLNFLSGIRKNDITLRSKFATVYNVILVNIFEERTFEDTSYTVCSIYFKKKTKISKDIKLIFPIDIYPSKKKVNANLNKSNNFSIGGEIYNLPINSKISISRLMIKKNGDFVKPISTRLNVKCIDDSAKSTIRMWFNEPMNSDNPGNNENKNELDGLYPDQTPKFSSRTYCTLCIEPPISIQTQKVLAFEFNKFLNNKRQTYHSLFLANYRESKNIARKRISFDLIYKLSNYILSNVQSI